MRIRGGSAKGREIVSPKGLNTRPTADKVKEAIFNVLAFKIPDAMVLDLCAGSGNLGLEAISRGAAHTFFVENNFNAVRAITNNINKLAFENQCTVLDMDVLQALTNLQSQSKAFNIIFFDPPYQAELYKVVLDFVSENESLLKENGVIVVECSAKEILSNNYNKLALRKESLYGDTKILYYQY